MHRGRMHRKSFVQASLQEEGEELHNPGCGWYHMYTFFLHPERNMSRNAYLYLDPESRGEQLVLLLIDIGAFRNCELTEAALEQVVQILHFFQEKEKDLVLRFAYDTQGKGLEREPHSISLIKRHMEQLGPVIAPYTDGILTLQGLFIGSWGEMHNSRFLSQKSLTELASTLYWTTKGRCYLAVRTPDQWRAITSSSGFPQTAKKRLGLFNDGMFGSPTDLGTYHINRQKELAWQCCYMRQRPNGGEVLQGESLIGYSRAAEEMRDMHISYLNSIYQKEQLQHWKEELVAEPGCWFGISGYEYVGRHLGYRFVVRRIKPVNKIGKGAWLQITVENCGFAELCQEADCFLIVQRQDGAVQSNRIDTDACQWESGRCVDLKMELSGLELQRGSRLFLRLVRRRDRRVIRFANHGEESPALEGAVLLGEYR